MAEYTGKQCDVFGTIHKIEQVIVTVKVGDPPVVAKEYGPKDLCPRAAKRLNKFIERGLSKPGSQS